VPGPSLPSDDEIVGGLLRHGLDVAYQPIVDVATQQLVGWEALLRGRLPEHGRLSPERVVSSAVRTGSLDTVMRQVAEQALATGTLASRRLGRSMTISLNMECEQLTAGSAFLRWLVDRSAAAPVDLLVEISERGAAEAFCEEQERALDVLRDGGVGLGIDDLGAGASRMRLLARGHWQWVKLDRGFLLAGERGQILLRHTVAMLHELGATVVLEGIETPAQLDVAHDLGVGLAQGNLLGVPIPALELLRGLPGEDD
jgi:EAL domain-containing protein (putative c-di-GMP-specific phosphodiesterase class I)